MWRLNEKMVENSSQIKGYQCIQINGKWSTEGIIRSKETLIRPKKKIISDKIHAKSKIIERLIKITSSPITKR
jgi:hypothetical protein